MRRPVPRTLLATVVLLVLPAHISVAAPFAYIANFGSFGDTSVIDTATNSVTAKIGLPTCSGLPFTTGDMTYGIAVNALGTRAYLTDDSTPGRVYVVNLSTNAVVDVVRVGNMPLGVAVHPNMGRVYVANNASDFVSVVDAGSNTQVRTVPVGHQPTGIAVNPGGSRIYVTNSGDGTVSVIDVGADATVATVPVGATPFGIAVSADGGRAYVANSADGSMSVIDTASNTVTATIPVGPYPQAVAVNPSGTTVYVGNYAASTVSVVDTATGTVVATVPTPYPQGVTVHPNGTTVYVANYCAAAGCGSNGTVSVIDAATNSVVAVVPVERSPISFGQFIAPGCQIGTCDDGDPCTTDTCDPVAGCSHSTIPGCPTATTSTTTSSTVTTTTPTSTSINTSTTTSTTVPEDAGFVPPDKVAARCSRSVVTLATKLAASIMKCHQRQGAAALAGTPFGEESCEAAAAAKYDGGIAKLTAAGTCL